MPKYGRRAAVKSSAQKGSSGTDETYEEVIPSGKTFTVPLKPHINADVVNTKNFHKVLSNEYSARLLESIGANPSKANIDMVRKFMPLAENDVKVSCKKKGALKDEVVITLPTIQCEVKLAQKADRARPHEVLTLGMLQEVAADSGEDSLTDLGDNLFGGVRGGPSDSAASTPGTDGEERIPTFEDMGSKFLFPFNLLPNPDSKRKAAHAASKSARRPSNEEGEDLEEEPQGGHVMEELELELGQEFVVRDETVLTCQSAFESSLLQWKDSIAEETLKDRITDEDFQLTISELSSDTTVNLFRRVVTFLYNLTIGGKPLDHPSQERAVFRIHEDYALIYRRYRRRQAHIFFTLPVLLLSLRVMVESLFNTTFPVWSATKEGLDALAHMDATITSMFDPHSYHSEISLLQSTPAAIQIMQRHPTRAHRQLNQRFYDTSPLTRAVIGQPASQGARTLLGKESEILKKIAREKSQQKLPARKVSSEPASPEKGSAGRDPGPATQSPGKSGDAGSLSLPHRRKLYKIAQTIHNHPQPYTGVEYHLTPDRAQWLATSTYSGNSGI